MMGRIRLTLLIMERLIIIIAACFATFPLYQYLKEAPDRKADRTLRQIQMFVECENLIHGKVKGKSLFEVPTPVRKTVAACYILRREGDLDRAMKVLNSNTQD